MYIHICNSNQNTKHHRTRKSNSKIYTEPEETQNRQSTPEQKNKAQDIPIPDLHYKRTVIKTAWYGHRRKNTDQQNRIEEAGKIPSTFSHLILTKEPKTDAIKKIVSLTKSGGKTGNTHAKEWLYPYLLHYNQIKMNQRSWQKNKSTESARGKWGKILEDINIDKDLLKRTTTA